jgi:hypothetical protein
LLDCNEDMPGSRIIVVLATHPDAVTGASEYLARSGVRAACIGALDEGALAAAAAADAIVLFADDYALETSLEAVTRLSTLGLSPLLVIVTEEPDAFPPASPGTGIVLVRRAVWAWTLVEALAGDSPTRVSDR